MLYFSQLWTGAEFSLHKDDSPSNLVHAAGDKLEVVNAGDRLYVWSFIDGHLWVVGRMNVMRRTNLAGAFAVFGSAFNSKADVHLVADTGTAMVKRFDVQMTLTDMAKIRFLRGKQTVPPAMATNGSFDPQTFRGVRQLTYSTAKMLDLML